MPNQVKKEFVHPGFKPNNSFSKPVISKGFKTLNGVRESFHLEREGNGVKIVSDGFTDTCKMIQSEASNAGLANIIRLQTLRYGTVENAIHRNADKQVYADVSKIPTNVAEQKEYLNSVNENVDKLCKELGISREDLLKSNQETLSKLVAAKNNQASNKEGGQE